MTIKTILCYTAVAAVFVVATVIDDAVECSALIKQQLPQCEQVWDKARVATTPR
jgi:hypothetical protein